MAETQQRRIDPESLSRMNAEKATPLQDIFVHCWKGKVALGQRRRFRTWLHGSKSVV